jgi:uncharacterized membrane-anchored protein
MVGYLIWFVALVIGVGVSFWLIANDEGDSISGWRGRVLDCSIGVMVICLVIAILELLDIIVWVIKWVF